MTRAKTTLILLFATLLVFDVTAILYKTYSFQTEDGSQTANVTAIWVTCSNSACTQIVQTPTSNLWSPNPKYLGTSTSITRSLPPCPETSFGYRMYFAMQNYQVKHVPVSSYSCYYSDYTYPPETYVFVKKDNCQATFTPTITSCAEAGLPLSILTDTQLDADTKSAFVSSGVYGPPELQAWREVKTRMAVDIRKQGSSSSVSGYPTNQEYNIYANTSHNFNFLWQTSKSTEPGTYVITMTSTVPDEKCDQTNMIPTVQNLNVYIAPTLDTCRAEVQEFSAANIQLNQPVTFTGKTLNEYQDWNYTSVSSCNAGNAQLLGGKLYDRNTTSQ